MSGTWTILEVTMGLPMGERRKLRKIERAIARTEPRLTAMFSMFSCLNRVEDMPRLERVRNRVIRRAARARRADTLKTNTALTRAMIAKPLYPPSAIT
jgi:phage shock protein A